MRCVVIKNIDMKTEKLLETCILLPPDRTVEEEVPETMKRQKLARYYQLRKSLTSMIGDGHSYDKAYLHNISRIPPLVAPHDTTRTASAKMRDPSEHAGKDIYNVLREYTLLTGRLTNEAKALRAPLMERDQRLIERGFLRQARSDFLALRQGCLSPAQLEEQEAAVWRAGARERAAAARAKKGEKLRRDQRQARRLLRSKSRGGGVGEGVGVGDGVGGTGEGGGTEGGSEGDSSGSEAEDPHADLLRLSFLQPGSMDIGELEDVWAEADFQVGDRMTLQLACVGAALTGAQACITDDRSSTADITVGISVYNKFLKSTRKEILQIADKRMRKDDMDREERGPLGGMMGVTHRAIRACEGSISALEDVMRRANVQNIDGAVLLLVPEEAGEEGEGKGGGVRGKEGKEGKEGKGAGTGGKGAGVGGKDGKGVGKGGKGKRGKKEEDEPLPIAESGRKST
ncbi:hypothetical protein B484DRAFT_388973 [Ochromonadaceae sp. CCMP2298]|nr:hypothetical protein B484DRAFT_388973 [Ochromonadaceae sp. CCMP2298]